MKQEALRVDNMYVSSDDDTILKNININIFKGELLSVFGIHESGKTTFAKAVSGFYPAVRGDIYIDGEMVNLKSFANAQKLGVFYLCKSSMLIQNLTVAENIFAIKKHSGLNIFYRQDEIIKSASILQQEFGFCIDLKRYVKDLSEFEKLIVQIMKVVLMGAKVVILDDFVSDIYIYDYPVLINIIKKLNNISFIYITNNIDAIVEISDRIAVMRRGKIVKTIYNKEYSYELAIQCAYGHKWDEPFRRQPNTIGEELLRIENMHVADKLLNFSVSEGEIVGILDVDGKGKEIISQIVSDKVKHIRIRGNELTKYQNAVKKGISVIRGSYKEEYYECFDEGDNVVFDSLKKISKKGIINKKMKSYLLRENLDRIHSINQNTSRSWYELRVLLNRKLINRPSIIVVDNITAGFDALITKEILHVLDREANRGAGILFIFSDIAECYNYCDKVFIPTLYGNEYVLVYEKETKIEDVINLIIK